MFWKVASRRLPKYLNRYHRGDDNVKHMCNEAFSACTIAEIELIDATNRIGRIIRALLGFGIKPDEIKVMLKDNPGEIDVAA